MRIDVGAHAVLGGRVTEYPFQFALGRCLKVRSAARAIFVPTNRTGNGILIEPPVDIRVLPGCGECRQDEFGMPYRLARCARKHEYESERRFEAFGLAAFARQGASKDGFGQEPKR